jgi:short-subunit dehydrogenase
LNIPLDNYVLCGRPCWDGKDEYVYYLIGNILLLTFSIADYNASKAALISLHESLRYELDHVYKTPAIRTTLVVAGHTLTRLFSTVKLPQSLWYKFLVPSVPPVTIVKAVIQALDEQHSRTIYLPFYANFAPYLSLMPSFIRDFGQWVYAFLS